MAPFYWWEYATNTTTIWSDNFYKGPDLQAFWTPPKNATVVPISKKVRDRENLEKVRQESLKREYKIKR